MPTFLVAHLESAQTIRQTQICKRSSEIIFLLIFSTLALLKQKIRSDQAGGNFFPSLSKALDISRNQNNFYERSIDCIISRNCTPFPIVFKIAGF